jgi:hypothetical protein
MTAEDIIRETLNADPDTGWAGFKKKEYKARVKRAAEEKTKAEETLDEQVKSRGTVRTSYFNKTWKRDENGKAIRMAP